MLDLLAALDHATPELLAQELELPVGLVERLLGDLEAAGLVGGEIVPLMVQTGRRDRA